MKIDTNTLLEEEAHLESGEKKKPCIGDIITLTCINSVYACVRGVVLNSSYGAVSQAQHAIFAAGSDFI